MSPRAACRLESLGFDSVYDYAPGKSDWTASGLPTEGALAAMVRPGAIADRDVATCRLDERLSDVKKRLAGDQDLAIVTSEDGIVLGRLRGDAWSDEDALAGEAMEPGSTTVRFDEFLPDLVERMQKAGTGSIIVTRPTGELIGVMFRRAAEEILKELERHHQASAHGEDEEQAADGHDHD
ncbi:MAG: hypothetical protein ACR2KQ_03020 [Actinomycetota bacterium]